MKTRTPQLHIHIERLILEGQPSGTALERSVQQRLAAGGLAVGLEAQVAQAVRSHVDGQTVLAAASAGTLRRDRSER